MYSIIVQYSLNVETNIYYVQKDNEICRFDGKCFFDTLEILSANVDEYFYTHALNKNYFESELYENIATLHTFKTLKEFKELMCEYLI